MQCDAAKNAQVPCKSCITWSPASKRPTQRGLCMQTDFPTRDFEPSSWRRWFSALTACGIFFLTPAVAGQAQAQSAYPNKPIRLLVPYGAGGVGDTTMRLLSNVVSQQVKQQIIVENRPSAGGIL